MNRKPATGFDPSSPLLRKAFAFVAVAATFLLAQFIDALAHGYGTSATAVQPARADRRRAALDRSTLWTPRCRRRSKGSPRRRGRMPERRNRKGDPPMKRHPVRVCTAVASLAVLSVLPLTAHAEYRCASPSGSIDSAPVRWPRRDLTRCGASSSAPATSTCCTTRLRAAGRLGRDGFVGQCGEAPAALRRAFAAPFVNRRTR